MMNPDKKLRSRDSGSTRMPLKLAGLFVVSFALFFILVFGYDLLRGFAERSAANSAATEQAPPIVVDPKIADDLAKVLAADADPNPGDIKDPFLDRAGLSGKVGASTVSNLAPGSMITPGSQTIVSANQGSTQPGNPGRNVSNQPSIVHVEGTKQRYAAWIERSGLNGATLDPRIFAIEDLLPVGIVDGGSGRQEVMFFSEVAAKTVSFPVGTEFFDGWLTGLRPEGVVFSSNDERRTIRIRSWARSVRNAG